MNVSYSNGNILITFNKNVLSVKTKAKISTLLNEKLTVILSFWLSVSFIAYYFFTDKIIAYGDAESHLNISKQVVSSLTPGFAQLGGIWLPLPHILMLPFVISDFMWRSGLAGSIVSGISYIVSGFFIYKVAYVLTKSNTTSFFSALIFLLNPNILYLQATPMTELPLIMFFSISIYFFVRFLLKENLKYLLLTAFFGFLATLTRYDGWFLVMFQASILFILYILKTPFGFRLNKIFKFKTGTKNTLSFLKIKWLNSVLDVKLLYSKNILSSFSQSFDKLQGILILYCTVAFFGIFLWLLWDYLILGDPFYFTTSKFSAKSQQMGWYSRGELPAYKNIVLSFLYYFVTTAENTGYIITFLSLIGLGIFLYSFKNKFIAFLIAGTLCVTFIFNVITLYMGQSVIFIPSLTPSTFEWTLFNVRYGVLMVPAIAVFAGILFSKSIDIFKILIVVLVFFQLYLFYSAKLPIISLNDGVTGLSSAKDPHAQYWLKENYNGGLVLVDSYARNVSIIRSGIPMENIIYIGTKPYWEESLENPNKHADWIIIHKEDSIWNALYSTAEKQGKLYKYYNKAYTSDDILIFKRMQ